METTVSMKYYLLHYNLQYLYFYM